MRLAETMTRIPTVAIIDDDESIRIATTSLVRSLGFVTATYESAEHFLDASGFVDADCLITDVQMPGMNGLDLQQRLIERCIDLPVIFITGFPDEALRRRAERAGAVAFLAKPFDGGLMVERITEALLRTRTLS